MKLGKRLAAMCAAAMMAVTGMVMTANASATIWDEWSLWYYPTAPTSVNKMECTVEKQYSGTGNFYMSCSQLSSNTSVYFSFMKRTGSAGNYTYSYVGSDTINGTVTSHLGSNCNSSSYYRAYAEFTANSYSTTRTANGIYYTT